MNPKNERDNKEKPPSHAPEQPTVLHSSEPSASAGKCHACGHGQCRVCSGCHNIDCAQLLRPVKACWDQLSAPPPPKSEEVNLDTRGVPLMGASTNATAPFKVTSEKVSPPPKPKETWEEEFVEGLSNVAPPTGFKNVTNYCIRSIFRLIAEAEERGYDKCLVEAHEFKKDIVAQARAELLAELREKVQRLPDTEIEYVTDGGKRSVKTTLRAKFAKDLLPLLQPPTDKEKEA